jgi:hypothetical protein
MMFGGMLRPSPLAMVLLAALLTACAPPLNWREVHPDEAQALVGMFPCPPDVAERRLALPGLPDAVTLHVLSCHADGAMWALSHVTVSDVAMVPLALRALAATTRANIDAVSRDATRVAADQRALDASPGLEILRAVELAPVTVPHMTPQPDSRAWRFETHRRGDSPGQNVPLTVTAWHFSHGLTVFQAAVWQQGTATNAYFGREAPNTFFQGFHFPG